MTDEYGLDWLDIVMLVGLLVMSVLMFRVLFAPTISDAAAQNPCVSTEGRK